jgi:hypothetical protein
MREFAFFKHYFVKFTVVDVQMAWAVVWSRLVSDEAVLNEVVPSSVKLYLVSELILGLSCDTFTLLR